MRATGYSTSTSLRGSGCRASNGLKPSTRTPCAARHSRVSHMRLVLGRGVGFVFETFTPESEVVVK